MAFHQVRVPLAEQTTVQWRFENRKSGIDSVKLEHYCLLDEVCWHPATIRVRFQSMKRRQLCGSAYFGQAAEVSVPATFRKAGTGHGAKAFLTMENWMTLVCLKRLLRFEAEAFHTAPFLQ